MKRLILVAMATIGTLAAGLVLTGHLPMPEFARKSVETKKPNLASVLPPAVSVARAETADFVDSLLVTGSLVAREEILVGPEIDGLRVLEVLVDEGDAVKKGQVLARLVNDTIDTQLSQNQAAIARAEAGIAQARSNIVQAEARVVEARNAIDRARTLKSGGHISESVFDQRDSAAKTTDAQLAASQDGLRLAEAEKAQAEAQRRDLQWRRGKTEVTAPAEGVVLRRNTKVGAMAAGAAEPMFRLAAGGVIELDAEVVETRIGLIREGQAARVQIAGSGFHDATVRLVSSEVDRATRMARVRLLIGAKPDLKIGMFARATIDAAKSRGVAIPTSAVLYVEDAAMVQVVSADKIVSRKIEIGLTSAGMVEVRRGVADGELVVVKAGTFPREGDAVRPIIGNGARLTEGDRKGTLQ